MPSSAVTSPESQRGDLGIASDEHLLGHLRGLTNPHDLPQAPRFGEALELVLAGVVEGDVGDGPRELAGHVGHEDLAALGLGAHAGGAVHRLARELAVLPRDFAGVEADADAQRRPGAVQVEGVERALDADRAGQGPAGRHEHDEEAVAERCLLVLALVLLDLLANELVVLAEERVGLGVAVGGPKRGRALDIREHRASRALRAAQERS